MTKTDLTSPAIRVLRILETGNTLTREEVDAIGGVSDEPGLVHRLRHKCGVPLRTHMEMHVRDGYVKPRARYYIPAVGSS
jgi:hypothetical protein